MLFGKTIKIKNFYTMSTILIFHDIDQRVHLWHIYDNKSIITADHADILEITNNRIILLNQSLDKMIIYYVKKMLHSEIQLEKQCDAFCLTDDAKYLFGVDYKKSTLFMYQVSTRECYETLFIENISPSIQATIDRLILSCTNDPILISISERGMSSLKR
jgi:hypothetical protein